MKNAKLNILLFALVSFVSAYSSDALINKNPDGMSRTERAKMNRERRKLEEGGEVLARMHARTSGRLGHGEFAPPELPAKPNQADTQAALSSPASNAVTTPIVGKKLSEEATAGLVLQIAEAAELFVQVAAHDRDLLDAYLEAVKSATTQEEKNELVLKLIAQHTAREKQREAARKTRYGAL